ncbi:MAG: hypothetical protein QXH91_08555 [Candidatus Bathyarchaeia archaeon]
MIGAIIFIMFFIIFLIATLGYPMLPPGYMVHEILGIPIVDYPVLGIPAWILINAIVNGVVYGFIIWLIFSLARAVTRPKKETKIVTTA